MYRAVRFASTSAKATSAASNLLTTARGYLNCAVYWAKVTAELGKYVWVKEGLAPPTLQQFKQVFTVDLLKAFKSVKSTAPQQYLDIVKGWNKDAYVKGGAAVIQLLGLFSLGEIIGRRHIYGYAKPKH